MLVRVLYSFIPLSRFRISATSRSSLPTSFSRFRSLIRCAKLNMAVTGSGCSISRNLALSSEAFTCTSPIPFRRSQNYATITTMAILLNASSCSSPRGLCLIFEDFNESFPASLELPFSYASQAAYSNKTNFKLILSGIGMLKSTYRIWQVSRECGLSWVIGYSTHHLAAKLLFIRTIQPLHPSHQVKYP